MTWPMTCNNNQCWLHCHTVVYVSQIRLLKHNAVLCSALKTHKNKINISSSHIPRCLATLFGVACFQLESLVLVNHCTVVLMLSEPKLFTMVLSSGIWERKHALLLVCFGCK